MRRWWAAAVFVGACSGQQQPPPPAPAAAPSVAEPLTQAAAQPSPLAEPEALSLDAFVPLLGMRGLEQAQRQYEDENYGAAAAEVRRHLSERGAAVGDARRWQFLLGSLGERAGDDEGAARAYALAGKEEWELSDYARLGAARALLRIGQTPAAKAQLTQIPREGAIAEPARLLLAEAAFKLAEYPVAIAAWRAHLERPTPEDETRLSLSLAEALVLSVERRREQRAGAVAPEDEADLAQALRFARRAAAGPEASAELGKQAEALQTRAIELLPQAERNRFATPTVEDELYRITVSVRLGRDQVAIEAADALLQRLPRKERYSAAGCEVQIQRAKAIAAGRAWGKAADALGDAVVRCQHDVDQRARLLYLAGKYAAADNRHTQAVARYELLEREAGSHTLADDARLRAAHSYFELGVEARFTELLAQMPRDYPQGDMVMEGVLDLALRRIDKRDWSGAAAVLENGVRLVQDRDSARGHEYSGRERYFLARTRYELGQEQAALDEYERIVRTLPLSYYMLHAYSRLKHYAPERAARAKREATAQAVEQPFSFQGHEAFEHPSFLRGMELLRVGEVELARRELADAGVGKRGTPSGVLWGASVLYAKAGHATLSHSIARGLLTDWLDHWPAGDWREAWELAFPRPHYPLVQKASKAEGVPEYLIYGVMREESAFDPKAHSPADAFGLMQLIVPTARHFAQKAGLPWDPAALKRPSINIALGSKVLASLDDRFQKHPLLAIPGYNAGPGRPVRWLKDRPHVDFDIWIELIPFRETRRYMKRVLASRAAYAQIYYPDVAEDALTLPLALRP